MTKTDTSQWHNTGGNGPASAVWVRKLAGRFAAYIKVMPYRCMLDTWIDGSPVLEGEPFETLDKAQGYADHWLATTARTIGRERQ